MHWFTFPLLTAIADIIALVFLVTSFVTEYWVVYDVDRAGLTLLAVGDPVLESNLQTMDIYRDRHKGLFRVCYTGDFDGCVTRTGYELNFEGMESGVSSHGWSGDYTTRVHLMRTHLFAMSLGIVTLLVTLVMVMLGAWRKSLLAFRVACCFSTMACFLVALSMAVFHGVEYVEKKQLDREEAFPASWSELFEHYELSSHVDIYFGFSLYLGWVALVLGIVGTILVMWTGVTIPIQTAGDSTRALNLGLVGSGDESYYSSSLARNRAYDIVEGKNKDKTDLESNIDNNIVISDNDVFLGRDVELDDKPRSDVGLF